MSIEDIADRMTVGRITFAPYDEAHEYGIQEIACQRRKEIIARAHLAATDDAQWSSKELKQLIRDLLRVTGL